ncbi:hypothetical protein ACHAXA_002412 [Cyclostephanos tholiformis]|uniref:Uncharacterized protein n=1 Tax=Cyclostephanos tholiformis TaxID=382380 RepID=A0ABD3S037_9STRA
MSGTMISAIISATLAAMCVSSADASALVRVRTLSQRKSLSRGRDAKGSFLDFEPTFRRLEVSMSMELLSISLSESLSIPADEADGFDPTSLDTIPDVVNVDAVKEGASGAATIGTALAACAIAGVAVIL